MKMKMPNISYILAGFIFVLTFGATLASADTLPVTSRVDAGRYFKTETSKDVLHQLAQVQRERDALMVQLGLHGIHPFEAQANSPKSSLDARSKDSWIEFQDPLRRAPMMAAEPGRETEECTGKNQTICEEAEESCEWDEETDKCSGKEDDKESRFDTTTLTALVLSLTFLICCTMVFEFAKNTLQSYATGASAPMVDALFAELTVLGFIGLIAFSLGQAGLLKFLSRQIFGTSDEQVEKLPELFEELHMILFLTMVIFIVEVVLLMRICENQAQKWAHGEEIAGSPELLIAFLDDWERACKVEANENPDKLTLADAMSEEQKESNADIVKRWEDLKQQVIDDPDVDVPAMWYEAETSNKGGKTYKELHWTISYLALRAEFITPRHHQTSFNQKQPFNFDYADYLSRILGETLGEIVEVPVHTWMFLEFSLGMFYLLLYVTDSNMTVFSLCYAASMYIPCIISVLLGRRLSWIRSQLVSHPMMMQDLLRRRIVIVSAMERSYLIDKDLEFSQDEYVHAMNNFNMQSCENKAAATQKGGRGSVPGDGEDGMESALLPPTATYTPCSSPQGKGVRMQSATTAMQDGHVRFLPPFLVEDEERKKRASQEDFNTDCCTWVNNGFTTDPPNPHEALFWFGHLGPDIIHWFMRLSLVLTAVYIPVQGVLYINTIIPEYNGTDKATGTTISLGYLIAYIIFSTLPVLIMYPTLTGCVTKQVHVTSVEMMVDKETVNAVKLSMRTKRILRIMNMINRLRHQAQLAQNSTNTLNLNSDGTQNSHEVLADMDQTRRREIERVFDHYDADNGGTLDAEELFHFLASLGANPTMETAEMLCNSLDASGDGEVDKQEFLMWIHLSEKAKGEQQTIAQVAEAMFHLFDDNGDGDVTKSEFEDRLEKLGIALQDEDLSTLMRELDPDGDGKITVEEFEEMLVRNEFQP